MIPMSANTAPRLARGVGEYLVAVSADQARGYPAGSIVFSIDVAPEVTCVLVAAVDLPSRVDGPRTTESFDDDFVIVHRNSCGQISGLQVLRYESGPRSAPEFIGHVIRTKDVFLFDAVATVMRFWLPIREACEQLNDRDRLQREWHLTKELESLARLPREALW